MVKTSADPDTLVLDDVTYAIVRTQGQNNQPGPGLVQVQQLGSYQQGVTIGSPDVNSHPYLSTWGLMDMTGGNGIATHQAGVTDNRYRYSTLDVSRPGQWASRWAVGVETGTAGTFMPLGDLLYSGNVEMYGAFGTDLHLWNESTDAWTDTTQNLTAAPVNSGVAFKGTGTLKLFIPLGTNGYDTWTGSAFAHVASDTLMFCVFGGSNLIRLDTTGQLYYSTDGSSWTSYSTDGKIDGADLVYKNYYHVGVAVGTDKGLVVPVVRDCENKSLAEIEGSITALAKKARDGQLSMSDMSGGTFTVTNGGVYGSLMATPIINPPQSAILGMHKVEDRPVVVNGQIVIRPMMYVAMSYDHPNHVAAYANQKALPFKVALDTSGEIAKRFGNVSATPGPPGGSPHGFGGSPRWPQSL